MEFGYSPKMTKFNISKLRCADSEIKKALYIWLEGGMPVIEVNGVSYAELIEAESMDPIQALLMLDWIRREPGVAFRFMTEESSPKPGFRLKKSDFNKLDEIITNLGGNPDKDPYLEESVIYDESDLIF